MVEMDAVGKLTATYKLQMMRTTVEHSIAAGFERLCKCCDDCCICCKVMVCPCCVFADISMASHEDMGGWSCF